MKAYSAQNEYTGYGTTVFAETRGKAIAAMMHTDTFEGWDFTEIRAYRSPKLDSEYRGHTEMDWCDDLDRMALVKLGWHCGPDSFDLDDCECCCASDYCDKYQDYLEESEEL